MVETFFQLINEFILLIFNIIFLLLTIVMLGLAIVLIVKFYNVQIRNLELINTVVTKEEHIEYHVEPPSPGNGALENFLPAFLGEVAGTLLGNAFGPRLLRSGGRRIYRNGGTKLRYLR